MKKIEAFKTSDGKVFEQREAAQVNEALYQFLKKTDGFGPLDTGAFVDEWNTPSIFRLLQEHFPTAIEAIIETAEEVAQDLAEEAEEVEFELGNRPPTSVL